MLPEVPCGGTLRWLGRELEGQVGALGFEKPLRGLEGRSSAED